MAMTQLTSAPRPRALWPVPASEPRPGSAATLGRRALPRVAVSLPVRLQVAGLPAGLDARTRDLSPGGVCVATPSCFPWRDLRRVVLSLPAGRVELDGEACWQSEVSGADGFLTGIRLLDVPDDTLETLWDLVHAHVKSLTRWLGRQPGFDNLDLQARVDLAHVTRLREARTGQVLYAQGVRDDSIFVLTEGEIAFDQRGDRQCALSVGVATPGQVVGGVGVVADLATAETAIVSRQSRLLEISRGAFWNLRDTNPALAFRLTSVVLHSHFLRIQAALQRVLRERR